jgi:hypothetical protein
VVRQVECLIPSKKIIVKMLTHVHKVVNTCWCWHICENAKFPLRRRSKEVAKSRNVFLVEKCATDAACAGVGHWPGRLSPNPSSVTLIGVRQGVGRVDARATDVDISVCR